MLRHKHSNSRGEGKTLSFCAIDDANESTECVRAFSAAISRRKSQNSCSKAMLVGLPSKRTPLMMRAELLGFATHCGGPPRLVV
jgi:hypothetical protein